MKPVPSLGEEAQSNFTKNKKHFSDHLGRFKDFRNPVIE